MTFSMKGWSAFYKTSKGEGTITCDNGESAAVTLKLTGGGHYLREVRDEGRQRQVLSRRQA